MKVWDSHKIYSCPTCGRTTGPAPVVCPPDDWPTVEWADDRTHFCSLVCMTAHYTPTVHVTSGGTVTLGLTPGMDRLTITLERSPE